MTSSSLWKGMYRIQTLWESRLDWFVPIIDSKPQRLKTTRVSFLPTLDIFSVSTWSSVSRCPYSRTEAEGTSLSLCPYQRKRESQRLLKLPLGSAVLHIYSHFIGQKASHTAIISSCEIALAYEVIAVITWDNLYKAGVFHIVNSQ